MDPLLPRRTARDFRVHRREFDRPVALSVFLHDLGIDLSDELRLTRLVRGGWGMASLCRVEAGEVGFLVGMRSASCSSRSGHWRADHGRGAGSERRAMVLRCCVSGENGSFGIGIGVLPGR